MSNLDCIDHGKGKSLNKYGYATVWHKRRYVKLHRLAYCQHHGIEIEAIDGQMVLHSCDNPRCINPDHLRLGSHADNMRDVSERRRHASLKLTDEQVAFIRAHCKPAGKTGRGNAEPLSFKGLGRRFGVGHSAVRLAYLRRTFKHLP